MAAQRPLLRVAVVGAGSIGREFALHHFGDATGTVVAAVVDRDWERAKRLAADVGSVQAGAAVCRRRWALRSFHRDWRAVTMRRHT